MQPQPSSLSGAFARVLGLGLVASLTLYGTLQNSGLQRTSAWIVDWDLEAGMNEWRANADLFDELHLFGAYFDDNLELTVPGSWMEYDDEFQIWRRGGEGRTLWMTVVNDYLTATARVQKDPAVVQSVTLTAGRRERHIRALVALAGEYGLDGIEIDYEQVGASDWPAYLRLIEEARAALTAEGIGLQVVLQPSESQLADPPPAVGLTVMSYNLHGMHSGPGPRNTPELVGRILDWTAGTGFRIALATGGFEWSGETAIRSFREIDALEIRDRAGAGLERTGDRNAHFRYVDDAGETREVWFEDAASLERQWQAARRGGVTELALWRLGGHSPELFDFIRQERTRAGRGDAPGQ